MIEAKPDVIAIETSSEPAEILDDSVEARVNRALDKVRPGIAMDGGEVWLIRVEAGTAYVQMLGACGGCPASTMTLKGAIEAVVVADVPEVTQVLAV